MMPVVRVERDLYLGREVTQLQILAAALCGGGVER